jgi:hypothetical protein
LVEAVLVVPPLPHQSMAVEAVLVVLFPCHPCTFRLARTASWSVLVEAALAQLSE